EISQTPAINAEFLREFSDKVDSPKLDIIEYPEVEIHAKAVILDRSMFENLLRFSSIINPLITIDWAMELIMARFRRHVGGHWTISTTKYLSQEEIVAGLDDEVTHKNKWGTHIIDYNIDDNILNSMTIQRRSENTLAIHF
ncbi:hypothetical protein PENTCL1PPCAC_1776, partial [Pristionchus entomophagus]